MNNINSRPIPENQRAEYLFLKKVMTWALMIQQMYGCLVSLFNGVLTFVIVVKSGCKGQREIDSWSSFRKLPSLQCTPHTRDKDQIPILCVGRLRWISQVSFMAYWLERSLPLSPSLFLLSRSLHNTLTSSLQQPTRGLAFSSTSNSMVCVLGFAYSLYPPGQYILPRQSAHWLQAERHSDEVWGRDWRWRLVPSLVSRTISCNVALSFAPITNESLWGPGTSAPPRTISSHVVRFLTHITFPDIPVVELLRLPILCLWDCPLMLLGHGPIFQM